MIFPVVIVSKNMVRLTLDLGCSHGTFVDHLPADSKLRGTTDDERDIR